MFKFVVDASVGVKWVVDEEQSAEAAAVADLDCELIVPRDRSGVGALAQSQIDIQRIVNCAIGPIRKFQPNRSLRSLKHCTASPRVREPRALTRR